MADEIEKLKGQIEKKIGDGWRVFHVRPYATPEVLEGLGEYRADKTINGTLIEVFGETPERLVEAAAEYDAHAARVPSQEEIASRIRADEQANIERQEEARPQTEQDLANLAVEVQPVALAELVASDPEIVSEQTKKDAGLDFDKKKLAEEKTPEPTASSGGVELTTGTVSTADARPKGTVKKS